MSHPCEAASQPCEVRGSLLGGAPQGGLLLVSGTQGASQRIFLDKASRFRYLLTEGESGLSVVSEARSNLRGTCMKMHYSKVK